MSELYTKPTHNGVLLHYTSTHHHSTKQAIATSEIRRATVVANTQEGAERGIKKVTSRPEGNGYLADVLQRARHRATGKHRTCSQRDQPDGVLVLLFISTAIMHQVRTAVRRSGLNIRIAHRSGPTLRSILTKSALEPPTCPGRTNCLACQAGLQGRCTIKNAVYRLECVLCSMKYIGETKRPIRGRLMEHRRAAKNRDAQSPWGAHYATSTPVPIIPFQAEIISRTTDHVDRKLTEAIHIAIESPPLNTDSRCKLLPTVRGRPQSKAAM